MRVTFLGTGTSRGIPTVGCQCRVCTSTNPRNQRLRSSVLIEGKAAVVIDTSVDFRTQMLRQGVRRLDALVFTHHHADHILGLDDAYPFNAWSEKALCAHASPRTLAEIELTFRHLFAGEELYPGVPTVELVPIEGIFRVGDLEFQPIDVFHGDLPVLGFRIGRFAYVTDVNRIPPESLRLLEGVEYLVLGSLRYESHPKHFSLSEAVEMAGRLGAPHTYLVHMNHDVDHDEGNAYLPDGVELAYDGQVLEIEA